MLSVHFTAGTSGLLKGSLNPQAGSTGTPHRTSHLSRASCKRLSNINIIEMQFYFSALFLLLLPTALAIPVAEPVLSLSNNKEPRKEKDKCPSQKPIAQNICTSGAPYCCSGTGDTQVCGPAGTVECTAMTICCINTNGVCHTIMLSNPARNQG